jgi:Na+-driven multidrug efflux pump
MPMAVVGIVMKFFQIVISIVVGMAAESTALSMVREVVFGVGFALLPRFFGLDGVLYSMPLSDILTFLIAGYLIYKTYHEFNYHIALDSGDRH